MLQGYIRYEKEALQMQQILVIRLMRVIGLSWIHSILASMINNELYN